MPKATSCLLDKREISVGEALKIDNPSVKRRFSCVECGERVRAHKKGTTNQAAHFEHMSRNPRCSRSHARS